MADSPKKAIALYELYSESIDIMVTDISMPEMNGYDLAELLRNRNPLPPVLFMSASLDLEAGARRRLSVISKPFTLAGLINSVAAALHSYPIASTSVFFLNSIEKGERNACR
jgi:CheY-like chemotaxis protein